MRLFDCFTFFNELDLLELRLAELDPVVDRFVLAESPLTFTGKPKPLFFAENRERFARYLPKIAHIVINDMPNGAQTTAWDREWHQRNALARGLGEAGPDDLVSIADIDEIPRPEVLAEIKADPASLRAITVLESELFLYFLNTRPVARNFSAIQAPRVLARRHAERPQTVRAFRTRFSKNPAFAPFQPAAARIRALFDFGAPLSLRVLPEAAWHFTYMGGAEKVRDKVLAYSHTEVAAGTDTSAGDLARRIAAREPIMNWGVLEDVAIDATFPRALRDTPERWRHLLAGPTS